ncbi:hypothetical protein KQX54_007490 [Cotesia glomerata]|uniref:Uncharacterized protein n=1 Tax=Cotesia glomerata TaxID=32391 RepID=A0AAV7I4V8_COTGL|nr:hypothetical protein KQX54_007490 [Cotesia glomerata]
MKEKISAGTEPRSWDADSKENSIASLSSENFVDSFISQRSVVALKLARQVTISFQTDDNKDGFVGNLDGKTRAGPHVARREPRDFNSPPWWILTAPEPLAAQFPGLSSVNEETLQQVVSSLYLRD